VSLIFGFTCAAGKPAHNNVVDLFQKWFGPLVLRLRPATVKTHNFMCDVYDISLLITSSN
jgi:hypothetical protein